jgi:hypothetical protein
MKEDTKEGGTNNENKIAKENSTFWRDQDITY